MRYIDYGTMQNAAQRRVLEMQRRAREAVYSTLPEERGKPELFQDKPSEPTPRSNAPQLSDSSSASFPRDPEETLITAVLALLLTEKSDIFLILTLLYLLM